MIHRKDVALRLYTTNVSIDYKLPPEQLEFTGMPQEIIKRDEQNPLKHLVIIYAKNKVAGFFELDETEDRKLYTDNPDALLLRGYSVDPEFQGRGIATGSIYSLPDFVRSHFPRIKEVVLGVNARNTPAQHVYRRAGFEDTGRRFMGSKGEQLVMRLKIK